MKLIKLSHDDSHGGCVTCFYPATFAENGKKVCRACALRLRAGKCAALRRRKFAEADPPIETS